MFRPILAAALVTALSACGQGAPEANPQAERDPAVAGALSDPIMADPDLASQNRGDSALSGGGPASAELPPDLQTPEEADKARQQARDMFGGQIDPAPAPSTSLAESRLAKAVTLQGVAEALALGDKGCAARIGYGFGWAAQVPAALPIYPRGHARVAAGTDEAGCRLRLVRFVTPAGGSDVVDFYFASARKAGLAPQRRREGNDDVVSGTRGKAVYVIYVRQNTSGLTEVDLATSGM